MTGLVLTALTAVSALGVGAAAHRAALLYETSGLVPNDFDPAVGGWIGRVPGVDRHVLPPRMANYDCRNNRLADMALRADGFDAAVAAAVRRYGAGRIAVILGTSTSGVTAAEEAYRARGGNGALPGGFDYDHTQDLYSVAGYVRTALGLAGPALVVSTACASSARCFMDAAQLMRAGVCDAAVVGGADSLCRMTLHGFAALELLSPSATRPCAGDRAGISIGEAAGFALLEREGAGMRLLGGGASSDGYHMSSPHPEGAGAVAAMRQALAAAGVATVDWINLHGTGTRANDAMEDAAVHAVFGNNVACSSTKGWTGHTLGACGILEALIVQECMAVGVVPGCLGVTAADAGFRSAVAVGMARRPVRTVMSNAFGFGGINCSLVFGAGC
jgi:3-oxoacyl-[acyl-carrier-protein] synthase-1